MTIDKKSSSAVRRAAVRYLKHAPGWVPNKELAAHVGGIGHLADVLADAVAAGEIQRRHGVASEVWWRHADRQQAVQWPPGFVSKWDEVVSAERARERA